MGRLLVPAAGGATLQIGSADLGTGPLHTRPRGVVIEWRMRAHDGQRLWGLRALSPFHSEPKGVHLREVAATELPSVHLDTVVEGQAEFVIQVPAGRRLEDRVLDVLRVVQVALDTCHLVPEQVHLDPCDCGVDAVKLPDEFLIVGRLMDQGICSLP